MGTCAKKKFRRKIDVKLILAFKSDRRNECRYYWCPECKAYHLTSQPRRGKSSRKADSENDMQARGLQ